VDKIAVRVVSNYVHFGGKSGLNVEMLILLMLLRYGVDTSAKGARYKEQNEGSQSAKRLTASELSKKNSQRLPVLGGNHLRFL